MSVWRWARCLLVAGLAGSLLTVTLPAPANADDLEELCAGPIAEAKRIAGLIKAHNAKPRVSSDRAYVSAYNAEARSLNAQQAQALSRVRQCVSAFSKVVRGHPLSSFPKPTPGQISKVSSAVQKLTDADKRAMGNFGPKTYDFLDYGPGKKGMTTRVDRNPPRYRQPIVNPVYKALDETRPTVPRTSYLQGKLPPRIGAPDDAYTNGRRVTGVAFDHIVPLRRLVTMRDFLKLTPENMWLVANSPSNTQWLSKTANGSKLSGSSAFISGADPRWLAEQARIRERAESEIQDLINALVKTQKG